MAPEMLSRSLRISWRFLVPRILVRMVWESREVEWWWFSTEVLLMMALLTLGGRADTVS